MTFCKEYAEQYDLLYGDKDYESECDILEKIFKHYGSAHTILDLGCGTGNHAIPLSKRGYQVTGVDISDDMLNIARQKSSQPNFIYGDLLNIDLGEQFDSVLMMFAVLGYQLMNVNIALQNVHRHLKRGGLFIFDVWYGPAVLNLKLSDRVKETQDIIRFASGVLIDSQIAEVTYRVISKTACVDEVHKMRYFFPQEIETLLNQSGLTLLSLSSFPNLTEPDETTWNVLVVARNE
jgi:SAM-dependent methyltransferase